MADNKLVILCITYNHVKFIRQALDGFVMQKTNFPFQAYIADDCSPDGTAEIIAEYAKKYPDIIVPIKREKNLGAMKNSIDLASRIKSEYVAFCEGDDFWTDPLKLQKQVDYLDAHPECSICFHPVKVFFEDHSQPDSVHPTPDTRFHRDVFDLSDLLAKYFIWTCSVVYRWRFAKENIRELVPENLLFGDYYIDLLHAQKGKIGFMDEVMGSYRRHEGGVWYGAPDLKILKYGPQLINIYIAIENNIAPNKTEYHKRIVRPYAAHCVNLFVKTGQYAKAAAILDLCPLSYARQPKQINLRKNLGYLLAKYGRLAFWGLGNYFLQNVPSSLSDQPGIFLVDKRHRYSFGQKQGQLPKILEKEKVELIIISAVTNSDPYRAISRDIGAGYPDALVIPLEHLLVSKFRKFWNQVAKCCTKLHLACGTVYKEGWLNIDNNSGRNLKSLDLCCDLSKGIPAQDNSVDFIYHEHFLEHLTPDEARVFLNECMRVLKHGGVMRLSMPDLDMVVRTYLNPEIFEKEHAFRESIGMGDFTPAAVINAGFRRWNHKYLYDRDELVIRLGEVGVAPTQIQFVNSGESVHPDLRNLETRHYSDFLIAEITKN